ncbi:hypothetical protein LR48_Vigan02g078200 [Vigna angularis]|uniref:Uncharacterized protein n=1 Tax=Phaseolus angularis TaxID=3914 RepID=A0A0L9TW50_PHAAN|nr:hypothetical protein LR48_Vigan02g078200 [Vigna angularis]
MRNQKLEASTLFLHRDRLNIGGERGEAREVATRHDEVTARVSCSGGVSVRVQTPTSFFSLLILDPGHCRRPSLVRSVGSEGKPHSRQGEAAVDGDADAKGSSADIRSRSIGDEQGKLLREEDGVERFAT